MEHQDHKVTYLRKSNKDYEKEQRKNGNTVSVVKTTSIQRKKILDDNPESYKVEKVSHSLRNQIQTSRMALKLTQKELAQKINVNPNIIQQYENGKAVPDNQILQKLRRVLNTKLTR